MNPQPLRALTLDEIRQYRDDGAVTLRRLGDVSWVHQLHRSADQDIVDPRPLHADLERPASTHHSGRFVFDTLSWPVLWCRAAA